ncbi:hypothetical protein PCANC_11314 [Puccinia coronata f. sp. avenae]|uniref:alpha-1,2-Mannosidase n=1 Tax=Puccinia coronata f. sp. avenae TaxID=200324 RepID=A0A2N5V5B7_9BASI|nr:hypothetical protein PCANC_11314 [Puccinia coronata f. sp. avenae]
MRKSRPPPGTRRTRSRHVSIGWLLPMLLLLLSILCGQSHPRMTKERKLELRDLVKKTWYHGFDNYITHAFPDDELRPLSCKGMGQDRENPNNHEINDVLGDFSMTLIDTLDTLIALRDYENFSLAVQRIVEQIPNFDLDSKVQVFETTIRVLGGLLSGHLFAQDPGHLWGHPIQGYDNQLLFLAKDLADRILPAFHASATGIPYARVNLRYGVVDGEGTETCTAGAGSLLLEFATLSRLVGDPIYENVAKKAFYALWDRRSSINLLGNTIDIQTGLWSYGVSSIGAGIDSFYEYILKSHVLLADDSFLDIWDQAYKAVMTYMRSPDGFWYRGVNMQTGAVATTTIDSLAAFWPGLQVLAGDIEAAIQSHMTYANLWARYSGIPEVFDIHRKQATALGYPLRPEFIESNYFLYRATKDEYYLEVAERVLTDLVNRTWVDCGLASIANLITGKLEDRQHSFMLSETLKYLYLTFDEDNPINHADHPFVFTTEGHILYIPDTREFREPEGYPTGWEERESMESDGVVWEEGRRRNKQTRGSGSTPPQTCPVFDPSHRTPKTSNPFALSITARTDFDYAKLITGSQDAFINSNHSRLHHLDHTRSPFGICEVPAIHDNLIELIFSHSEADIESHPGADKVELISSSDTSGLNGTTYPHILNFFNSHNDHHPSSPSSTTPFLLVKNLTGLTFSLKKHYDEDSYEIVKVSSYVLSPKTQVILTDPYAVKVLKPQKESAPISQRDRDHLAGIRVYYEEGAWQKKEGGGDGAGTEDESEESISRPVMMATFGPDVRVRGATALSLGNGALEVVGLNPPNEYGCLPIARNTPESLLLKQEKSEEVQGKVVLIRRGECTFADKNHFQTGTSRRPNDRPPLPPTSPLPPPAPAPADHTKDSPPALQTDENDPDPLKDKMHELPLLFSSFHTGRSIANLLANRLHSRTNTHRKLLIEIVDNPLDLLTQSPKFDRPPEPPSLIVINGYPLSNLVLQS